MVTKNDIKNLFKKGMKPSEQDFDALIESSFNNGIENYLLSSNNLSTSQDVAFSGATLDKVVDSQTIEYTNTSAYGRAGFVVSSAENKTFAVSYELTNIGNTTITRWGLVPSYNSSGAGMAVNDTEYVVQGSILPQQTVNGTFIFKQTNTRPRAIPAMFSSGINAKFKLTQKIYDITNTDLNLTKNLMWHLLKDNKYSYSDISMRSYEAEKVIANGSQWKDENALFIGDSITASVVYQNMIRESLGFKSITTRAVAGRSISQFLDNVTQADLDNNKLVFVYGFFNDFKTNSSPLGSLSDSPSKDGSTFVSRLKWLITTIKTMKPNCTLVIAGTHNGTDSERPLLNQPYNGSTTIYDAIMMIKRVCEYYSIPFIDVYSNCGINEFNLNLYTSDGLHLNNEGNKLIANVCINGLQRIQPYHK